MVRSRNSRLRDWNSQHFPNILWSTSTLKVSTVSASLKLTSLPVLKISHVFEKRSSNLLKEGGWGLWGKRSFLYHFASCSQIAWAIFMLGFQTTCWEPYYLIWGVLCKVFLFYQVHCTPPQPRLIAPAMPQETRLAVCRGAGDWRFHSAVSPGVGESGGVLTEHLWGLIWEASFYLM